jgi:Rod binding domain-containing protein
MELPAITVDPSLFQQPVQTPRPTRDADAARRVAEDFEAFFIAQMMEEMFAGIEPDSLFGGGVAEGPLRSLLFQEYGKAVAGTRGIGIADMVQKEILRLQEVN